MASCLITLIDEAEVKGFGPSCFADFAQAYLAQVRPEALAQEKPKPVRRRVKAAAAASSDGTREGESNAGSSDSATGQA